MLYHKPSIAKTFLNTVNVYGVLKLSASDIARNRMSPINLMSLTDDQKKNFLNSFDTLITDCDGVLWHSDTPVPGAQDVMTKITTLQKKRLYFTNNSTKTRSQFVTKFKALGFPASEDEIFSTAWLTAKYLKNKNFNKKVYVIGSTALQEELNSVGIENFGAGPDNYSPGQGIEMKLDPGVGAVVIGYDFYFSFPKLMKACTYLNNHNCLFIATNTDERFPIKDNVSMPGAGAFVASLEKCSERKPEVMGKPSPLAIDSILVPNGIDPKRCLMVGDRCNTDIQFGNSRGMTTLLVETGVHKLKDIEQYESSNMYHLVPTYYTSSIADLLKIMNL